MHAQTLLSYKVSFHQCIRLIVLLDTRDNALLLSVEDTDSINVCAIRMIVLLLSAMLIFCSTAKGCKHILCCKHCKAIIPKLSLAGGVQSCMLCRLLRVSHNSSLLQRMLPKTVLMADQHFPGHCALTRVCVIFWHSTAKAAATTSQCSTLHIA